IAPKPATGGLDTKEQDMRQGRRHGAAAGWRQLSLAALLGLSLLGVVACEGDNGAAGPDGPGGSPGPTGPTGPTTGTTVPITTSSIEGIVPDISSVTVPADSGKPVVQFKVTDAEGRALTGLVPANVGFALARLVTDAAGLLRWETLTQRVEEAGTGSWPGTGSAQQGTTESGTVGVLVDNGDGSYTYTFGTDIRSLTDRPYDANLVHRIGMEIRNYPAAVSLVASNSPYTFKPGTGEQVAQSGREIVDDDTCETCHDKLEFHGGVRTDTQYCVVCHNPSSTDAQSRNTVDMTVMIHRIHAGAELPSVQAGTPYQIWGFRNELTDFSDIEFPADVRDCRTCHEEGDEDTPQASNWRTQPSIRGCGSCHDDVNFQTGLHHRGIVATDADCSTCHGPNTTFNLSADKVHFVPQRQAARQFAYELVAVTNTGPGQTPRVTFRVNNPSNDSVWNIQSAAPFTQCGGGNSRLSIDIGWSKRPDYTTVGSGLTPAQPIQLNPLTACGGASTANGDGSFTVTSTTPIPATATGTAIVAIEGHPAVDADGDGTVDRIPVRNVHRFAGITDATAQPRRDVVDIRRCDQCHGVLSLHGNNRTDDIQVCATCHNPNATDVGRRVAGSECVNELGTDDAPIDLKYMIHAIHAGNIDVCGFGNTANRFGDVSYPGQLNNCEGCHLPNTYYPVDATPETGVLPTTFDAGADVTSLADDRAVTPNSAVCSACHASPAARAHMDQNGGSFDAAKTATGRLASGTIETCGLCHGSGRVADVKQVHQVPLFEAANKGGSSDDD
ncbi:MAG: OmcA/MtrC family decaheme c-type cytochrome, partial [Steroidobacteraceae bacterium]